MEMMLPGFFASLCRAKQSLGEGKKVMSAWKSHGV